MEFDVDWCRKTSRHRYYRQRGLKSYYAVRTHLYFSLSFVTTLPDFRSLVGFGPKQRAIGEAAKTQETSNFKNTIGSLKRLIGRTLNDPQVQNVEKKFINAALVDVGGTLGVDVSSSRQSPLTTANPKNLGQLSRRKVEILHHPDPGHVFGQAA